MSGSSLTFGTQWLGQLPDDWSQMRARYLFRERKQKSNPDDIHLTPSQKYAVLPQSEYMKLTGNRVVLNITGSDNMKHVESGDFVIHLRSFQGGIEYSQYTGKVSNAYTVLQPKETVVPDFFRHVLKSYGFISELSKTTDQLRDGQSIKFSQLDLLEFPLPSPETQQKIADFLDAETAQIDNLIAKQERLLELLEEKRRATITHAVTRGLNPSVELKETNIPWLGQVPVHWELYRAKYLFGKIQEKPLDTDEVVTAFRDGEVVLRSLRREDGFTFADKEIGYQHVNVGDLVIHAMDAFAGAVGVSKSEGKMSPVCSICRPIRSGVDTEYYAQLVRAMTSTNYLVAIAKGIRERSTDFRFGDFSNMTFPLPPLDEQRGIISRINDENEKVAKLKQKIQTQITLLRERRTSLISHAVTGKVKV